MPSFRIQRPQSISATMAQLINSSPNLGAAEMMEIEDRASQIGQRETLADKARAEVDKIRQEMMLEKQAEEFRRDPSKQLEYAASAAGIPLYKAAQLSQNKRGEEGIPPVEGLSPEQVRRFENAVTATIGNLLGTGKSNVADMARAGGEFQEQGIRGDIAATPDVAIQNQFKNAIVPGFREPFGQPTGEGLLVNQETGGVTASAPELYESTLARLAAQAAEDQAQAGAARALETERTTLLPFQVGKTKADTAQSQAAAGASSALAKERQTMLPFQVEKSKADTAQSRAAAGSSAASAAEKRAMLPHQVAKAEAETAKTKAEVGEKMQATATKDGKQYVKINGQWFEQ